MAAIAREPLVSAPLAGIQDQSDSRPSSPALIPLSALQPPGAHDRNPSQSHSALHVDENRPATDPVIKAVFRASSTISGEVLDRDPLEDGKPYLSEISFEGMSFAVPQNRAIQVPGNFGTLTVSATGAFSYARTGDGYEFTDAFICTARGAGPVIVRIILEIASEPQ